MNTLAADNSSICFWFATEQYPIVHVDELVNINGSNVKSCPIICTSLSTCANAGVVEIWQLLFLLL